MIVYMFKLNKRSLKEGEMSDIKPKKAKAGLHDVGIAGSALFPALAPVISRFCTELTCRLLVLGASFFFVYNSCID